VRARACAADVSGDVQGRSWQGRVSMLFLGASAEG
jgi:hypothetical protein